MIQEKKRILMTFIVFIRELAKRKEELEEKSQEAVEAAQQRIKEQKQQVITNCLLVLLGLNSFYFINRFGLICNQKHIKKKLKEFENEKYFEPNNQPKKNIC